MTKPNPLRIVSTPTLAEQLTQAGPSREFVGLTRNPGLRSPVRFEPTVKRDGDVVI